MLTHAFCIILGYAGWDEVLRLSSALFVRDDKGPLSHVSTEEPVVTVGRSMMHVHRRDFTLAGAIYSPVTPPLDVVPDASSSLKS